MPQRGRFLTSLTGAIAGAETLCAGYGVTLSLPTAPPAVTPPPATTTPASNVSTNTTASQMSVFTGAAPQAEFFVSGAFIAGAGFLLALF